MATTILDSGASLKITIGTQVRNIIKAQIEEVSVIKTNIIKIDLGKGALDNIFIPFSEVTTPVTNTPDELRDAILALLLPPPTALTATEAKQIEQIGILTLVKDQLVELQDLVTALDNKIFYEPLIVDDSGAGVIYNGYSVSGSSTDQTSQIWAIERIKKEDGLDVHTWANGNKTFTNRWSDRETLSYS